MLELRTEKWHSTELDQSVGILNVLETHLTGILQRSEMVAVYVLTREVWQGDSGDFGEAIEEGEEVRSERSRAKSREASPGIVLESKPSPGSVEVGHFEELILSVEEFSNDGGFELPDRKDCGGTKGSVRCESLSCIILIR